MQVTPGTAFAIGVDFGTNSARALVVDCADGREIASFVVDYPSGEAGILLDPSDPNLARQHPGDYVVGFEQSIRGAVDAAETVAGAGFTVDKVVGIGVDTTGSTPMPVDERGTPLGMKPEFRDTLAAQAWLWKDHTSHAEAAEITKLAQDRGEPYLAKCGGTYSSEWFWSKILKCCRTAPDVFDAAHAWVEIADWIPAYACGTTDPGELVRGVCAAGHKAMFHEDWGGLPSEAFLAALDPKLSKLRGRLYDQAVPSSERAGTLAADVAERCGLRPGVAVAAGAFDAHHGAVGAGCRPGTLVKIMGTSTCDISTWPIDEAHPLADIPGLCGIVPGSVVAGQYGLEAGQSAVGDLFNWVAGRLAPAGYTDGGDAHVALTREAERLLPGATGLLALDWNNGNRTVLVNPRLSGLLLGQTLHTTAAEVYRAVVEATAFGALMIVNRFEEYGVTIDRVVNCGGIAEKSPFVMQIYADVMNRPMQVSRSSQTCALGAAIFGSMVGGVYDSAADAQDAMTGVKDTVYTPNPEAVKVYAELFALYSMLHDAFGGVADGGASPENFAEVMPRLMRLRETQRTQMAEGAAS
ncbi:MAG: ribulokinase [Planctomycetota bacterium]